MAAGSITAPTQGMHVGLEMDDYRAMEGVSASDLKNMQRSPAFAHMRGAVSTPAQEWGTAIHTAILEPEDLHKRYALDPEQPADNDAKNWRATKLYKEMRAAAEAGSDGFLTAQQFADLEWIQKRVKENKIGASLHEIGGVREASFFAWDEEFGLWRKCRPDWYIAEAHMAVDVKSAADHLPGPFARASARYGYHITAAWYIDTMEMAGHSVDHYPFLVVNSAAPFEPATYTLDQDSIEQGRFEYRRALAEWRDCAELGKWPCGSNEIQELRLPEYAITYHYEENK